MLQITLRQCILGVVVPIWAGYCFAGGPVVCRLVDVDMQFDGLDLLRYHNVHGRGVVSASCINSSAQTRHVLLQVYDENPRSYELVRNPSSAEKLTVSLFVDEARQVRLADQPGSVGVLRQRLSLKPNADSRIEFPFFVRLHALGILTAGAYEKQSGFRLQYDLVSAEN